MTLLRPAALRWACVQLAVLAATACAQPAAVPLQPMALDNIGAALARPIGQPVHAPRTSGTLDLRGKKIYIAEYLLLFDLSGELNASGRDARLLGITVADSTAATLIYRSAPDIAALQALTDRAWADLQARLQEAGLELADAAQITRQHGAVYPATEPASTPGAPVVMNLNAGDTHRRYLALAPSGMRLTARTVAGIGLGNIGARVVFAALGIEGLSLGMALNFSALDPVGPLRRSSYAAPTGGAPGAPALSPLMELAPAPAAALVHAHTQLSLVNLGEALVLAGEFARLRPVPELEAAPKETLAPLLSLGRRLLGGAPPTPRVEALLELDGPATARLALFALSAANQGIVDAIKAARAP